MFKNYQRLLKGDWQDVDEGMLWPLTRWASGSLINLGHCSRFNRILMSNVPKPVLLKYLGLGIRPAPVCKYPKAAKVDSDKRWDMLQPYLMQYWKYSERELVEQRPIVETFLTQEEFLWDLHKRFGFDNRELKTLGLKVGKIKAPKVLEVEKKVNHGFW